jgi:hypothetical protein
MKVVGLSALPTGRLYLQELLLVLILLEAESPQDHSATGRIMTMKYSNDIIENQTHDIPACSAVPQPTVLPRSHAKRVTLSKSCNIAEK